MSFVLVSQNEGVASHPDSPLVIESSYQLPLKELSGVHWTYENGKLAILAVGDKKSKLVKIYPSEDVIEEIDFSKAILDRFSLCQSALHSVCAKQLKRMLGDWEALRIDSDGRVFLLQEHSEAVVVFNPNSGAIDAVLNFNLLEGLGEWTQRSTRKFPVNALGEGLLLMKNGHFAVAKEMYPLSIVEFGPQGDQALGLTSATVLSNDEEFLIEQNGKFKYDSLARWELAASGKCDFSDLEFARGQLFILSQKCKKIMVIDPLHPETGSKLVTKAIYSLPKEIKNPEALTILEDGRFVIGSDLRKKKKNLFIIESPFSHHASLNTEEVL